MKDTRWDAAIDMLAVIIVAAIIAYMVLFSPARSRGQELPPPPAPGGVPETAQTIELGRKIFNDPRVSGNGTVACATCHQPARGFSDGQRVAVGNFGRLGTRNSPTVIGANYLNLVFWDGRTVGVQRQALQPLTNRLEMGNASTRQVMQRLSSIPGYRVMFAQVYGEPFVREATFAHAIASYESSLVPTNAPIQRRLRGENALSEGAERGFQIAQAASCFECHTPPLFTDGRFHNTGVELEFRDGIEDAGRSGVIPIRSRQPGDVRAFKTPTLFGIRNSSPYFHAGQAGSLGEVVEHYARGAFRPTDQRRDASIDRRIRPLGLSADQRQDLVTFLEEAFEDPALQSIGQTALP